MNTLAGFISENKQQNLKTQYEIVRRAILSMGNTNKIWQCLLERRNPLFRILN